MPGCAIVVSDIQMQITTISSVRAGSLMFQFSVHDRTRRDIVLVVAQ